MHTRKHKRTVHTWSNASCAHFSFIVLEIKIQGLNKARGESTTTELHAYVEPCRFGFVCFVIFIMLSVWMFWLHVHQWRSEEGGRPSKTGVMDGWEPWRCLESNLDLPEGQPVMLSRANQPLSQSA